MSHSLAVCSRRKLRVRPNAICFVTVLLAWTSISCAAPKERPPRIDPDDVVGVTRATFLGGAGTEYLNGVGLLPDGRVVVTGVSLGPVLNLPGHPQVPLLGDEEGAAPPAAAKFVRAFAPIPEDAGRNETKAIRRTRKSLVQSEASTPFIAVLSPSLDRVERAVRLPWQTGRVAGVCVMSDGAVLLTGVPGPGFSAVTGTTSLGEVDGDGAFLLKVSKGLDRIEWSRRIATNDSKPAVRVLDDGRIVWLGRTLHVFSATGELLHRREGLIAGDKAINPRDGSFAIGGDRNSGTGREPWRQPYLYLYDAEGSLQAKLYETPGIVVGSDFRRLVSDSAIRGLHFDPDGEHLWIAAWSDGGNSIMNLQPFSATERITHDGLGLNMAGANATSAGYYLRLNLETLRVDHRTIWSGYFKGPHGSRMYSMHVAPDGSLVTAGSIYAGPIMTDNHLVEGPVKSKDWAIGGPAIAVFRKDLERIRFSSIVPAAGLVDVRPATRHEGENFLFASGMVDGKHRVVAVGLATAKQNDGPRTQSPPLREPLQQKFGGGAADGYVLVFEW